MRENMIEFVWLVRLSCIYLFCVVVLCTGMVFTAVVGWRCSALSGGSFSEFRLYSGSDFGYLCVRFYNSLIWWGCAKHWCTVVYINMSLQNSSVTWIFLYYRLLNCFLWAICETFVFCFPCNVRSIIRPLTYRKSRGQGGGWWADCEVIQQTRTCGCETQLPSTTCCTPCLFCYGYDTTTSCRARV